MKKRILEICVDSLQSALVAQQAGADRIELCACLDVGGVTPDQALFTLTREKLSIPIHVLIRPRPGDFVYDDSAKELMLQSIIYLKAQGADGLVLGALTEQHKIDEPLMTELMNAANPVPVTFHRAFDQLDYPMDALPILRNLGVRRILTSGQQERAVDGLSLISNLVKATQDKLTVLPGGGINSQNVGALLDLGVWEVHASARTKFASPQPSSKVNLSSAGLPGAYRFADYEEISNLRTILQTYDT